MLKDFDYKFKDEKPPQNPRELGPMGYIIIAVIVAAVVIIGLFLLSVKLRIPN